MQRPCSEGKERKPMQSEHKERGLKMGLQVAWGQDNRF